MIAYVIAGVVYLIATLLGCVLLHNSVDSTDFAKYVTIWLAITTTLLGAMIAVINTYRQNKISSELENQKSTLIQQNAAIARQDEGQHKAIDMLVSSMKAYYDAFSNLQNGKLDLTAINKADAAMKQAYPLAEKLHKGCKSAFEDFYQRGNYVKESIEKQRQSEQQRRDFWLDQVKGFSERMDVFLERCRDFHGFV